MILDAHADGSGAVSMNYARHLDEVIGYQGHQHVIVSLSSGAELLNLYVLLLPSPICILVWPTVCHKSFLHACDTRNGF